MKVRGKCSSTKILAPELRREINYTGFSSLIFKILKRLDSNMGN
jgi:hypothetical protein